MRLGQREKAYDVLKRELDNDPDAPNIQENFQENMKQLKQAIARAYGKKVYRKSVDRNRPLKPRTTVDFPRLTLDELYSPQNARFLEGKKPFILVDVFAKEKLRLLQRKSEAVLQYYGDKTQVDYIPFGSHLADGQPHALMSLVSFDDDMNKSTAVSEERVNLQRRALKSIEHTASMPIDDSRFNLR
eukprot:gb/GECG01011461.1/.p1 GENE.gb/GECG01011461.1/~~gb/GECG01011461.1/.p1  ORF type:complete len:187 (+),score=29.12 gb/GECG01011461.1/:1-561(+)